VDRELIIRQFDEIEQKVEGLIDVCKKYESANIELRNRIEKLEAEIQIKIDSENNYEQDKAIIRSKIDGLISKLDNLEINQ